jgi:hypothetical protein
MNKTQISGLARRHLLQQLSEDGTWVLKHVAVLYMLCALHPTVHLLENLQKTAVNSNQTNSKFQLMDFT